MLVNSGGVATQSRAPSHERPLAAQRAAGHGWLSAALEAPGDDVPLATTARAPGHHCLSAALQAPGVDLRLAITAGAPGHHRLSAASIATVSLPAGLHRLRQECLPRVPANPRTPIYPHSHRDTVHTRTTDFRAIPSPCTAGGPQGGQVTPPARRSHHLNRHSRFPPRHSRESGNPRPPVATGGPPGGYAPATCPAAGCRLAPSPGACSGGGLGRGPLTTHHVYPAVQQAPPHPRSCSTACTGLSLHHPSRAPPPRHCGAGRNPRPPAPRGDHRGATLCSLCALWPKKLSERRPPATDHY